MLITEDDGLLTPEVGGWAEAKYKLVRRYDNLFTTGMKNRWDQLIYIDLYAGAGKAKIRNTNKIVLGSPLLAVSVPDRFTKYIFCDERADNIEALRTRIEKVAPEIDAHYLIGDSNELVQDIIRLLPVASKNNRVLSFCFVDPFDLGIEYATLRSLSRYFVDFLILLALGMDGLRNECYYVKPSNNKIEAFLGLAEWREQWLVEKQRGISFQWFLASRFANQMVGLGYDRDSINHMIEVRSDDKNLPLYHLAFFSRHPKGYKFWKEVKKYSERNPSLFED